MDVLNRPACWSVLRELTDFLVRMPGTPDVEKLPAGLRVVSENLDFLLRPVNPASDVVDIRWTVTVREPHPRLGTWWTEWTERHVCAADVLRRLDCVQREVDRMLLERAAEVVPLHTIRVVRHGGPAGALCLVEHVTVAGASGMPESVVG